MEPARSSYPATLSFDPPERVANWRPLVNWLLAIPHFIVLYALQILSEVVALISWFVILFTGKMPESFANVQAMYLRYEFRTYLFAGFLQEEYPPFDFTMSANDAGGAQRVRVDFTPELTNRNRVTVGLRIFLIIPQLIVLALLLFAGAIVHLIAFFAVLFTGKWPEGMRAFVLNVYGWYLRVSAYAALLTDRYPPFAFED
jgi:hypothetical protein